MGQLVTTVVGGVAGFLVGGPLGASIGMTLGGMVGQTLFGPTVKGPRLNDLKVSASTYGKTIPEIYGTVRIGGNMLWTTGIRETSETRRAGKGGPKQTTYSYDASFAMGLCKGPIDDLLRIWADGKLIYDKTNGSTRTPGAPNTSNAVTAALVLAITSGKRKDDTYGLRIYLGTEDQEPDSLIEADKGVGNVSAHRGMAYCVFENMQLENYGNRIPQLTFEVTRTPNKTLPYARAKLSDGTTTHPVYDGSSRWFPDWDLGIALAADRDGAYLFNLSTMTEINRNSALDFAWQSNRRIKYLQGTGNLLAVDGLRNSAPLQKWNIFTLSRTGTFGTTSNATGGFVNYEGQSGVIGFGASNSYGIGNLGEIGFCRSGAGTSVYLTVTWTRFVWIIRDGLEWPAAGGFQIDWVPSAYLEGRRGLGYSDIIGWRGANGRLELQTWYIGGGINFRVIQTPSGPDWESGTDYSVSYTNVNPFGTASAEFRDVSWTYSPRVCLYDETDDCIFSLGTVTSSLGSEVAAFKWQRSTGQFKFARIYFQDVEGYIVLPTTSMEYSRIAGGTFGWARDRVNNGTTPFIGEIDLQNGDLVNQTNYGSLFGNSFAGLYASQGGMHWDDGSSSLIANAESQFVRVIFRGGVANLTIADVVADVCLRTNILGENDFDVSGLSDDPITGYLIDRETSARDVLRQLATGFLFDGYESDYKLKFRSRGDESQVTIPEDWIARDSDNLVVKETVTQELDMPMRVTVNFYDITRDHQQGSQTQKRIAAPIPSMLSRKEDIVELPITWTPDEGKRCADKLLKMHWANRTAFDFTLPWRYLKYDPTDVATVVLESGTVYEMRLTETLVGADFSISTKAVSEKATAYVSDVSGALSDIPLPTIGISYPAIPYAINTPLLRDLDYDADENAQVYLGAGSNAINFTSASLFINDGFDFANLGPVEQKLKTGFCQTALPPTTSWGSTDNKTQLVVRFLDPTIALESITQEDMLNTQQNAALVGDEIIQFRDATQQADGSWLLTGLLRARRGTNYAVNNHVQGDPFILLEPANLIIQERPPEAYNVRVELKAVPPGTKIDEAETYPFDLTPRDLQPYTPEEISIEDDGVTVTVKMQRRSRIISPLTDGSGVIHYREGEKADAKITYKVWFGLDLTDIEPFNDPDLTGEFKLFNADGSDAPNEFDVTYAQLGSAVKMLVYAAEVGAVTGIPKWFAAELVNPSEWNITELY
ncbi:tail protein [Erythrobacter phage vB_EliS-L02]|nr:tail protein [Erythrobacter phage vB_EliS-L02]